MDIKLAATTGEPTPWVAHADFLKVAGAKLCQVKTVIDVSTAEDDLVAAARCVNRNAPDAPLILQPRTIAGRPAITGRRLLSLQAAAAREHRDTLVIPQMHPLLAVR
jgi:hypothetical protein